MPDIDKAQRTLAAKVMGRPGVSGIAIGEKGGRPCLKVYLSDSKAERDVPRSVSGVPVVVEKTGPFKKL